jgi:diguanylate cyclase (GGDEF)-like protein/PAS domain S-box-containing protein
MDLPDSAGMAHDFAAAMNLALIVVDGLGAIQFANPAFCSMFGYQVDEMRGRPVTMIIPERMRGAHTVGMSNVAAGAKPGLGGKAVEVSAIRSDGTEFPIEITLSTWKTDKGFWAGAAIKDISERRERDAKLMRLASHDTLTGLQNRHEFMNTLAQKLSSGMTCSLFLMDLDGFKEVNDTHGHIVGDSLLQAVAVRIPYLLGDRASVGRLGGDEFAICYANDADLTLAEEEASAILHAFRKPFSLGSLELELGASIGIAIAPLHGSDADELLASADFALYRAKAAGGRTYRLFEPSMRSESQARRAMRDELRRAMRSGELELYYQPQVELCSRRIVGFEALIRWNHPTHGLLLPGRFLPSLEQSSVATEIGWWTLDEACRMAALLNEGGEVCKVAVNLFAQQFRAPNLRDRVVETVRRHGLSPACLELEVTEEIALNDNEASLHTLKAIRDIGVGVAFDDFGTGYASLSSLQRFPLKTLKIDKAFISDIQTSASDAAITRALVAMSREMGLDTVAEGIETEAQAAVLLAMGCDQGQGYLFGRPMPAHDAIELYRQSQPLKRILRATAAQ